MEEVSAGLPVALTVSDYTGHTCALWEARFPELRQMALEQCRWFKEEEVGKGERHIFLFDRLPAAQRIVYIALSVYPTRDSPGGCLSELFYSEKEFPLHFDEGSTPEKSALLNLHVDWGHLVLIIQTAPDFPIKKLAKELADACEMEGRIFLAIQKTVTITAAPGRDFLPDTVQLYQILSPYWSEKKLKV